MRHRVLAAAVFAFVTAACTGNDKVTAPNHPTRIAVAAAVGTDSVTGATIETNQDDYTPGEIVHVDGRGWVPNETVNLYLSEEPDTHEDVSMNVQADSTGAFSVHFYDVQQYDLGVQFTLTATGMTSASKAIATFTDGTISLATVEMRDGAACSSPQGSVAAGTPICAHSSFTLSGSGGTAAQLRWKNPSGTIVAISQRAPDFANGTTGINTYDATFTPTATGTWTILLCESNNDNVLPSGVAQCASGSQKASQTFVVTAGSANTSVAVVSNTNPSVTGQGVTFTATVTAGANAVTTGSVTFKSGGTTCADAPTTIGTVTLDGSGKGTSPSNVFNATETGVVVRACYGGASGFNASEGSVTQTVNKAATTTTLVNAPATSSVGETVTFTPTVSATSPGAGTPTNTISVYEFTGPQSCASLGGAVALGSAASGSGITVNSLTVGTHTITACYPGDVNFSASAGSQTQTVSIVVTTTEVTSSVNPSVTGQSVTFTATVKNSGNAIGAQGNVLFKLGGANCADNAATTLATVALNGSGQAQALHAFQASQSPQTVRACYAGNASYASSEGSLTQTVNKASTTTTLSSTPNPSTYGQTVTFTATVAAVVPGAGVATGSVAFYQFAAGGSCASPNGVSIGSGVLSASGASITYNKLPAVASTVSACYVGDNDFAASDGATTQTVNKAPLKITASSGTKVFGTTFTVTPSYYGFVLSEGPGALGTLPTCSSLGSPANASVTGSPYTTSCSGAAADNYTIQYVDGALAVTPVTTGLTLATPASTQYSDKVQLSASVSPTTVAGSDQAGSVEFFIAGVSVGSATLSGGTATKSDISNTRAAGNYNVTAKFTSANANFKDATDGPKTLAITQEDASIIADPSNSSAINFSATSFQLKFSVKETYPELAPSPDPDNRAASGDISNAGFKAMITGISSPAQYTGACSATGVSGSVPSYTAMRNFTCTFSGGPFTVDAYTLDVDVIGNYYVGSDEDALTIFDPNAGSVTGGGRFSLDGDRVSFGLSFTYTKGKTTPRGGLVVVRHHVDGGTCRVKSNSMDAPAVNGTTASFTGKGNYTCVNAVGATTASAGNLSILGYVEDNGTSGASQDKFWIRANGELLMALQAPANAALLTGGNIQVPQPSSK